jgi:hypothetical protein
VLYELKYVPESLTCAVPIHRDSFPLQTTKAKMIGSNAFTEIMNSEWNEGWCLLGFYAA